MKSWGKVLGVSRCDPAVLLSQILIKLYESDLLQKSQQVNLLPLEAFPFTLRTTEKAAGHLNCCHSTMQNSAIFQRLSSIFSKLRKIKPRPVVLVSV